MFCHALGPIRNDTDLSQPLPPGIDDDEVLLASSDDDSSDSSSSSPERRLQTGVNGGSGLGFGDIGSHKLDDVDSSPDGAGGLDEAIIFGNVADRDEGLAVSRGTDKIDCGR